MKCSKCGGELQPNDRFCGYCGCPVYPMSSDQTNQQPMNSATQIIKQKKNRKSFSIPLISIAILLLIGSAIGLVAHIHQQNNTDRSFSEQNDDSNKKPKPNVKDTESRTDADTLPGGSQDQPPEEKKPYEWVVEPSKNFNDIQPFYSFSSMYTLGVLLADGKYLVDYDGNTLAELEGEGYVYDTVCNVLTNFQKMVDPRTFELVNYNSAHGLETSAYVYDVDTGLIYSSMYGEYAKEYNEVNYAIVAAGKKVSSTGTSIQFELTGKYGVVQKSKLVIPCEYDGYIFFNTDHIVALKKDGKWGYFDEEGNQILDCIYSPSAQKRYMYALNDEQYVPYASTEGYIALCKDGKWGFADIKGNYVTDFEFEEARPVNHGKAWVKTENGWGIIKLEDCPEYYDMSLEEAERIARNDIQNYMGTYAPIYSVELEMQKEGFYKTGWYNFKATIKYTNGKTQVLNYIVSNSGGAGDYDLTQYW